MARVEIYQKDKRIGVEYFTRDFFILESKLGELFWDTGKDSKSRSGEIKTWIQKADTIPRILTVLPDWELMIDGITQELKFYDVVENLAGKLVELRYKEYRFIFNFIKGNSEQIT